MRRSVQASGVVDRLALGIEQGSIDELADQVGQGRDCRHRLPLRLGEATPLLLACRHALEGGKCLAELLPQAMKQSVNLLGTGLDEVGGGFHRFHLLDRLAGLRRLGLRVGQGLLGLGAHHHAADRQDWPCDDGTKDPGTAGHPQPSGGEGASAEPGQGGIGCGYPGKTRDGRSRAGGGQGTDGAIGHKAGGGSCGAGGSQGLEGIDSTEADRSLLHGLEFRCRDLGHRGHVREVHVLEPPEGHGETPHLRVHHPELASSEGFQDALAGLPGRLHGDLLRFEASLGLLLELLGLVDPGDCSGSLAEAEAASGDSSAGEDERENHGGNANSREPRSDFPIRRSNDLCSFYGNAVRFLREKIMSGT